MPDPFLSTSRRDFVRFCTIALASVGIPFTAAEKVAQAVNYVGAGTVAPPSRDGATDWVIVGAGTLAGPPRSAKPTTFWVMLGAGMVAPPSNGMTTCWVIVGAGIVAPPRTATTS